MEAGFFALAVLAVGLIVVLWIPVCVYCSQKWTHRCFEELQKTNAKLQVLIDYEEIKRLNHQQNVQNESAVA